MPRQVVDDEDARHEIQAGVSKLARAFKVTPGPTGRNVFVQQPSGSPPITEDGVTVSTELQTGVVR